MKRAQFFILADGKSLTGPRLRPETVVGSLISRKDWRTIAQANGVQLSMFDDESLQLLDPTKEDEIQCLTGQI